MNETEKRIKEYCEKQIKQVTDRGNADIFTSEGLAREILKISDADSKESAEPNVDYEEEMVCSVCGQVDDSFSAYCGKCGRSDHFIRKIKKEPNVFENERYKVEAFSDGKIGIGNGKECWVISTEILEKAIKRSKELQGEK